MSVMIQDAVQQRICQTLEKKKASPPKRVGDTGTRQPPPFVSGLHLLLAPCFEYAGEIIDTTDHDLEMFPGYVSTLLCLKHGCDGTLVIVFYGMALCSANSKPLL